MTYIHYGGTVRSSMSHYGGPRVTAGENVWILFLCLSAILRNTQNGKYLFVLGHLGHSVFLAPSYERKFESKMGEWTACQVSEILCLIFLISQSSCTCLKTFMLKACHRHRGQVLRNAPSTSK